MSRADLGPAWVEGFSRELLTHTGWPAPETPEGARTLLLAGIFGSTDLELTSGLGSDNGGLSAGARCTIGAINLALTGWLSDDSHPCIDEAIRCWVMEVQDDMPHEMRNSAAWRAAAVRIAGTAPATAGVVLRRKDLIRDWMYDMLLDEEFVRVVIPPAVQELWREDISGGQFSDSLYAALLAHGYSGTTTQYPYRWAAHFKSIMQCVRGGEPGRCAHAAHKAISLFLMRPVTSPERTLRWRNGFWQRANPAALLHQLVDVGRQS